MSDYEDDFEDYQDDFEPADPSPVKIAPPKPAVKPVIPSEKPAKGTKGNPPSRHTDRNEVDIAEARRSIELESTAGRKLNVDSEILERPMKKSERKSTKPISQPIVTNQNENHNDSEENAMPIDMNSNGMRRSKPVKRVKKYQPMDLSL